MRLNGFGANRAQLGAYCSVTRIPLLVTRKRISHMRQTQWVSQLITKKQAWKNEKCAVLTYACFNSAKPRHTLSNKLTARASYQRKDLLSEFPPMLYIKFFLGAPI